MWQQFAIRSAYTLEFVKILLHIGLPLILSLELQATVGGLSPEEIGVTQNVGYWIKLYLLSYIVYVYLDVFSHILLNWNRLQLSLQSYSNFGSQRKIKFH